MLDKIAKLRVLLYELEEVEIKARNTLFYNIKCNTKSDQGKSC